MQVENLRFADFAKNLSMLTVIGSLLYMYAYSSDEMDFINNSKNWITELPKTLIFYFGLGIFAIFNFTFIVGIGMYKNVQGVDEMSILFKSKEQKQRLLMWFTYLWAGINILITSIIFYLALSKIHKVNDISEFLYLPTIGLLVLAFVFIGMVFALFKK